MAQETLTESPSPNSDFINTYVAEHKQELEELRTRAKELFDGQWFIIGDDQYPQKRVQYATTSFGEEYVSPRIILYPTGEKDIQKAIKLCRELKMAIAVRTGGHQYCGFSSTLPVNMQIDLSKTFPLYDYNAETNVLRCGVSQSLGFWANKNNELGIYLPMGVCPSVHLGGHVHTGGWGMVARSHGLLADHVLAFDIILASGEKLRIVKPEKRMTSQHNDDLYYAVLGGGKGGDFGIVTHWEFRPLRDRDYPNSACYLFVWEWSKEKMEGAVRQMGQLSKLCEDGTIPSDYEFVLNITGIQDMDWVPEPVKDALRKRGLQATWNESFWARLEQELTESRKTGNDKIASLSVGEQNQLTELSRDESKKMGDLSEEGKELLRKIGILDDEDWVPPLIQMWMCFTNKAGEGEQFDDQWFESFTKEEVCGSPIQEASIRGKNTPVSTGLAKYFIMKGSRETPFPFVKRFQATMDVPQGFPETYTDRMYEIMGNLGTRDGQYLVSQQQIYTGGAVAKNGETKLTSYSWREQTRALSYDSFYLVNEDYPDARKTADDWQKENDRVFINEKGFADKDMRMVAYTFGDRVLENVWQYYYDSEEKYNRLRIIKGMLDPDGLFSADDFSLKPLIENNQGDA
jgi:FAD/FMN-containing dehydrogenase